MTSVSQVIPTYALGGISNQPDELKKPGQVRDCVNAYPDLIDGLYKRNGFELVSNLQNNCTNNQAGPNGSWFTFIRENPAGRSVERFVGKVSRSGQILIWDVATGLPKTVYYSRAAIDPSDAEGLGIVGLQTCQTQSYLSHTENAALRFNSINDYTFIANSQVAVTMNQDNNRRPYEAFIEITQLAPNREYLLNVDLIDTDDTTSYRTVNTVSLTDTDDFGGNNRDPSCPAQYFEPAYQVDESFVVEGGRRGQTGLILSIESLGSQVLDGDGDYECKYRHQVEVVNGGRDWKTGDVIELYQSGGPDRQDNDDASYQIEITDTTKIDSYTEYLVTGVLTPNAGDVVLTVKSVLDDMKAALIDQAGFADEQIQVIGNGLYVTREEPFIISTTEKDLMNILSNEDQERENPYVVVNSANRLPIECKDGIIAKVANSFINEDDYWVQFNSNYGGPTGASGYWEEVPEPGGYTSFNAGTMPHALVYARENSQTVFVFGPVKWNERKCGDDSFNPSFENFPVNHISFYRNRLVMMSKENVIMSKAGDLFNFFPSSALAVSPTDPIDLSASTDYSSVLQDALVINNGLVIFSNYQQFLFTTDSDILDPTTAKLTEISRYEYNVASRPFAIGTNVGFVSTSSNNSRLYEMSGIFREGSVDVAERSEIIAKSLPPNISLVTQSKETGLIMLAQRDTNVIWGYRYFKESANQDIQTVWFRWTAPFNVIDHFILDNDYYAVLDNSGDVLLAKVSLETMQGPFVDLDDIPFEMKVEFPTINLVKRELTTYMSDTTSSLVVHRAIFNFADIGTYHIDVQRDGMDTYENLYESRYMDEYKSGETPVYPDVERYVPVYTRNENLHLTLRSDYQLPLILRSMRWEGDYNQRYYRRV